MPSWCGTKYVCTEFIEAGLSGIAGNVTGVACEFVETVRRMNDEHMIYADSEDYKMIEGL